MGSDTAHDADTLSIHHDAREQHVHLAAVKAALMAAREFDEAAAKAGAPLPTPACTSGQEQVCTEADSVRSTSYDVDPGQCVMCLAREPEQQRKCAELHPGVCDVRALPGAADSEGGECA